MAATTELVKSNVVEIERILTDAQERIASVLPSHIRVDRMISVALEMVSGDSKLCLCEPLSILKGVMEASQLGLLLNKHLGHAYLVPFQNGMLTAKYKREVYDANFLIGYRGFIEMVMRSNPNVSSIYGRIVYTGEEFYLSEGTEHQLIHRPSLATRPLKDYIGAYAIVLYRDSTPRDFEWMPRDEVEKIHKFSKAQGPGSPWATWTEEMIKKTPLRRLCKRLKLSPDMIEATVRDEYRELGYEGNQERRTVRMPGRASEQLADEAEAHTISDSELPAPVAADEQPKGKPEPERTIQVVSVEEREEIFKLAKEVGFPGKAEVNAFLLAQFGCKSTAEVTAGQYPKVLDAIRAWKPAESIKADTEAKGKGKKKKPEAAVPKANAAPAQTINDDEKGRVWQSARTYLWTRGTGHPDDPLHVFLMRPPLECDSVAKIPKHAYAAVMNQLRQGPQSVGLEIAREAK